jgi:DNA (cytosine-5)-methyltransferase 1
MIDLDPNELVIDYFAGGGGASTGIEEAIGRPIDIALNHDPEAVAMHAANHPRTKHYCKDAWEADPLEVTQGRPVGLGWFSPDCKHFSRAKGGKPVSKRVRGLAWVVVKWAKAVRPRIIMLENVSEFATWGPLLEDGTPCNIRKGFTFRRWCKMLQNLGYELDMRELVAAKYGAGTTRKRLYIIARCDGRPIVWPEETHGPGLLPYVTAADCIDWSIPCPSIFERSKPLADATLRRIARGITRYVVNNPKPFIVTMRGTDTAHVDASAKPVEEPLSTVSAGGLHHALVTPIISAFHGLKGNESRASQLTDPLPTQTADPKFCLVSPIIAPLTHHGDRRAHSTAEPLPTITGAHRGELALIAPTLIQTGYGERNGQAPRTLDLQKPLGTAVAGGVKHGVVAAFIAKHYGDNGQRPGLHPSEPMSTITSVDHHALVHAFLLKYYGTDQNPRLEIPLGTVTTKDRFGLVTVMGDKYYIADIGMRMLTPRELFNAQSFPPDYKIDPIINGKHLSKTAQVRMAGNSVCRVMSCAMVRANFAGRIAAAEVA